MAHFDPDKKIFLQSDASKLNGLGYILTQEKEGKMGLIQCGSRFLLPAETRYSATEIELLGIVWAMKKCNLYVAGNNEIVVVTDHRALLSILNNKSLADIRVYPRIVRLQEKVLQYNFITEWKKGKHHCIPDALSRSPVEQPTDEDRERAEDLSYHVNSLILNITDDAQENETDPILSQVTEAGKKDEQYTELKRLITKGFPTYKDAVHHSSLQYWNIRNELTIENDVIVYGNRLVIPRSLRKDMLQKLHASHQGREKTKRRARQTLYWPGINNDIDTTVKMSNANYGKEMNDYQKKNRRYYNHNARDLSDIKLTEAY